MPCTIYVLWNFTSRGTSHFVAINAQWYVLHVLCYSMSCENQDFHGKFLNFTHKYPCVTTHGLPHNSGVTVELYHMYTAQSLVVPLGFQILFYSYHFPKRLNIQLLLGFIFNCLLTKSNDILNKNTLGAKKCKTNQKQQLNNNFTCNQKV